MMNNENFVCPGCNRIYSVHYIKCPSCDYNVVFATSLLAPGGVFFSFNEIQAKEWAKWQHDQMTSNEALAT